MNLFLPLFLITIAATGLGYWLAGWPLAVTVGVAMLVVITVAYIRGQA